MPIVHTSFEGFRNLRTGCLEFSPHLNLFIGENGSGKTNTLEAIYLSTSLRSFRRARLRELVAHDGARARVESLYTYDGSAYELRVEISARGNRRAWLGGRSPRRLEDYLVVCPTMSFTPGDLAMVKGGPEARRNFLDDLQVLLEPAHLARLREFKRLLRNRNALLRQPGGPERELLESFHPRLVKRGSGLSRARAKLVNKLQPLAAAAYNRLSGDDQLLALKFQPGWPGTYEDFEESLDMALRGSLARDKALGHTSYGPQHDDVEISLGGHAARNFASQGEQRSCALALLLAGVALVERESGRPPPLLLDDVAGELDARRRRQLFESLLPKAGQVFVTTTELSRLELSRLPEKTVVFRVVSGLVERHTGA